MRYIDAVIKQILPTGWRDVTVSLSIEPPQKQFTINSAQPFLLLHLKIR